MFKYHSDWVIMFLINSSGLYKKKNLIFFLLFLIGKSAMVLEEKGWLFLIGNGAEIRPLEMGRKSPFLTCQGKSYLKNDLYPSELTGRKIPAIGQ